MARVRQLLIGLASGSALYSGMVPALGLGEITLHSALSQPLDAEIELLNIGDLSDSDLQVRLAPAEVFSRSGVERLYFLNDLRFTPLLRGGRSVIRVVSARPVREPYLNFIVEVAQLGGQMYREYTVLLDPPGSSAYRSLAASPAVPAAAPILRPSTAADSTAPARPPRPLPAAELGQAYTVLSGDSLWKIAARLRAAGSQVSQQNLMSDIHALNPQAFIRGDINRLIAGVQLLLPDSAGSSPAVTAETAAVAPVAAGIEGPEAMPVDPPASATLLDPATQLLLQEQSLAEQELAQQIAETTKLQQSLAELELQVQQLQAQVTVRDQQIAGLQAELAAAKAGAGNTLGSVSTLAAPNPLASGDPDSSWLKAGLALLALLLAAVVGLFWRSRNRPQAAPVQVKRTPPTVEAKAVVTTPKQPAAAVQVSQHSAPSGAIWPTADTSDALQSANVYIGYGRLGEAVVTLGKALQAEPERADIAFRLLEVLAQLGDAQGFTEQEASLRATGFNPTRIDELKARHAELFAAPPSHLLDDVVLQLDEEPAGQSRDAEVDGSNLNLDDMSLDADWDLVNPFSPSAPAKTPAKEEKKTLADKGKEGATDVFEKAGNRDARSPFAESMLVEEAGSDAWLDEELNEAFAKQPSPPIRAVGNERDDLANSRDNLAKLNMALAYIEQGSLDSACDILNEVISNGDEKQKQRARQLLAKIA